MGSLPSEPPLLLQDLKVEVVSSTKVFPPEDHEKRAMFLSNIDQVLNFNVQTVHFFEKKEGFSAGKVVEDLKTAMKVLLVEYDFMAGRMRVGEGGRMEVDCNGDGVGLVSAASGVSLEELGDLEYPNPAFKQLASEQLPDEPMDQPLCVLQVTSFNCGSFALGVCTNHCTFDGASFGTFIRNLASVAAGGPLAVSPFNNRRLLAARSPPRVTFLHPELVEINNPSHGETPQPSAILDAAVEGENLHFELLRLTSDEICSLKDKAVANGRRRHVTSFNALTAHLWRCRAFSTSKHSDDLCSVLFAVDLRRRLDPPLPESYTGNAVLTARAAATRRELADFPFVHAVDLIVEAAQRMTDDYARSVIDWGEDHKGFPMGDMLVSSWWKLGFEGVEYPWGKPKYCCPVVSPNKDIVLLFPPIGGGDKGVNVLIALPQEDMERFSNLFYKFLS